MAIALVQAKSNTGGTGSGALAVGSGQGWATPTSGNLLVAFTNSDNTATVPTGFTAGPSVVDGNGAYSYYKISDGTESTITFGNGADSDVGVLEYSGIASVSPLDVSNSATRASTLAATSPSVSVTTTAAGDLIVCMALTHAASPVPSAPSWTNSFTNRLTTTGVANATAGVGSFIADLTAGAAGAQSTVCTWTTSSKDCQALMLAFKAAAGGAAVVVPKSLTAPRSAAAIRASHY